MRQSIQWGWILTILLALALLACGGDDPTTPPEPGGRPSYEADPAGTLLEGAPGDPAIDAVGQMLPSSAPPEEILDGRLTTRLTAFLAPGATVAQVNASLEGTGTRIVSMVPESPFVSLVVPAQASREDAETLTTQIAATEGFVLAYPVHEVRGAPREALDPSSGKLVTQSEGLPQHLQLTRMEAAWNALALAMDSATPVTVVVADHYSVSTPHEQISAQHFPYGTDHLEVGFPPWGNNGFAHSGILGADPGAVGYRGVHPAPADLLRICSVPIAGLSWIDVVSLVRFATFDGLNVSGRSVISTSLEYGDPDFDQVSIPLRALDALAWRYALISWVGPGAPVFHLTTAGDVGNAHPAVLASPFAFSGSFDDLPQATVDLIEEYPAGDEATELASLQEIWPSVDPVFKEILGNTLVVGSSEADGSESPASGGEPHIRMPGAGIPGPCVTENSLCVDGTQTPSGARVATPQAAGLVAYLWNLNPSLASISMQFVIGGAYVNESLPGFVDAYAAVLSLDPNVLDAQVRETILDLDENGDFDELDLAFYLQVFESESTDMRFDLNGDGTVGGPATAWFDLSVDGLSTTYTIVTQDIGCEEMVFNESTVTDWDILVYYAYSDLYSGEEAQRNALLELCPESALVMEIEFPAAVVEGVDAPLSVRAGYQFGFDDPEWTSGIDISIEVVGGTVSVTSDTTDVAGFFHTSAQLTAGNDSITLTITASDDLGLSTVETVTALKAGQIVLVSLRAIVGVDDTGQGFDELSQLPIDVTIVDNNTSFCAGTNHLELRTDASVDSFTVFAMAAAAVNAGGTCSNNTFQLVFRIQDGSFQYHFDAQLDGSGTVSNSRLGLFDGDINLSGGHWIECSDPGMGDCPETSPGTGTLYPGLYTVFGRALREGSYTLNLTLVPIAME